MTRCLELLTLDCCADRSENAAGSNVLYKLLFGGLCQVMPGSPATIIRDGDEPARSSACYCCYSGVAPRLDPWSQSSQMCVD